MCDRYMLSANAEDLAEWFKATPCNMPSLEPNFNAAPTDRMPIIREDEVGRRTIERYSWGLLPYWATEEEAALNTLHARAETLADTSTFKPYFTNRRCLVPAGGFYLWKRDGKTKTPYLIRPAEDPGFAIAGLYGIWEAPTGEIVPSYCLITTVSGNKIYSLNDRMPAILGREAWDRWLDPDNRDTDALRELIVSCPDDTLRYYRVSEDVNFVTYNSPELIEPADKSLYQ